MDQSAILKFIGSLSTDKKTEKAFSSMKDSLDEIYKIKEKELKDDEKEWAKEKKEAKTKARNKKRKEADKGKKKGLLSQVIGTKSEAKKSGNDLMKMLLAGGLTFGVGALAWNYKEEIGEYVDGTLKPYLMDLVGKAAEGIKDTIVDWTKSTLKKAYTAVSQPVVDVVRNNIAEPLQDMAGGHGYTKDGNVFTLTDVTGYRDMLISTVGTVPDELVEPINNTAERLRIDKSLNDQLYRRRQELEETRRVGGPGSPGHARKIEQIIKDTEHNRIQNRAKMTESWSKLGYADSDLVARQKRQGRRDDQGYIHRQTGGTIDNDKTKKPPSGKEIDERMFSTTDYEDGASIARRPSKEQRLHLQTGGLVLFQGHGDVPAGHSAPGTDGPGTAMQGKYKPTAEQHFVDKVARKTELLAQRENVPIKYQRSTGKYAQASHPKSNWSLANGIRRKGGSAMELHFDAWGMQNGRMIEGARGILKGSRNLSKIEKSVQNKFGTHPMSGQGWGTLMLELDSLKYAKSRIDAYPRMLVDAVKNSGAKGGSPRTQSGLPNANSFFSQYDNALTNTTPSPTPSTSPTPSPTPSFTMPNLGSMVSSVSAGMGAFMQGFSEGFSRTFKNPFAKAEQHQNGGVVGRKQSKISTRMQQANSGFLQGSGNIVARPVVVVKRKAGVIPPPSGGSSAPVSSGGGGLNMVDAAAAVHRLTSGSKF